MEFTAKAKWEFVPSISFCNRIAFYLMNSETNTVIRHPVVDLNVDPPNSQASKLTFGLQRSVNVNRGTLFIVGARVTVHQFFCILHLGVTMKIRIFCTNTAIVMHVLFFLILISL